MHLKSRHNHMIDFLFPLALFFFFTLSALTILLLSARIYQSTVDHATFNNDTCTALSYISEKVHQHDTADSVAIDEFDHCHALRLTEYHGDSEYHTYIYSYDGYLMELYIKNDATAQAASGTKITPISNLTITEVSDQLLQFNCIGTDGTAATMTVGLRSHN